MITRRSAVRTLSSAVAGLASTVPARARQRPAAFALVGDRFHNSDYIRVALGKTLVKDLGLSIDFTDEVKELNAARLSRYKLFILFRDNMTYPDGYEDWTHAAYVKRVPAGIVSDPPVPRFKGKLDEKGAPAPVPWLTPAQGRAVREFASNGGGILLYHNAVFMLTVQLPENEDFRDVLGSARALGHPPMRPYKVKIVNREHPITRNVHDFVVTDEQHFMVYTKDPKYVLLRSVNEDGLTHTVNPHLGPAKNLGTSCEAGWAYDYGKGRVCYLMPGHMIVNLWNPEYEKIQQNAARWLLRQI